MSSQRLHANELAKLLNSAMQPIYVLDDDLTIVFLNRACVEWFGTAAEGLLGQTCASIPAPRPAVPRRLPPDSARRRRRSVAAPSPPRSPTLRKTENSSSAKPISCRLAPAERSVGSRRFSGRRQRSRIAAQRGSGTTQRRNRRSRTDRPARTHPPFPARRPPRIFRADRLIGQGPAMCLARRQVALATASR